LQRIWLPRHIGHRVRPSFWQKRPLQRPANPPVPMKAGGKNDNLTRMGSFFNHKERRERGEAKARPKMNGREKAQKSAKRRKPILCDGNSD